MVGAVSPDSKYKLKSSFYSQPSNRVKIELIKEFNKMHQASQLILHRSLKSDLSNTLVASADNPMVKMPLGDKLMYLAEHQLRHLNQIKRIQNHLDFPH